MYLTDLQTLDSQRVYGDEGFLTVPGKIARTGIQMYKAVELEGWEDELPDKMIPVYRPPSEVFAKDSLSTFAGKPLTNNHPTTLVNSRNSRNLVVGTIMDVKAAGKFVEGNVVFYDEPTIRDIENGKSELSVGYTSRLDKVSGVTPDGEVYEAIQRDIRVNHVALVPSGRAGPTVRLADNNPEENKEMAEEKKEMMTMDMPEDMMKLMKMVESMSDAMGAMEKKMDEYMMMPMEKEEMEKESEEVMMDSAAQLDALVEERSALVAKSTALMDSLEWKGKSNHEVRLAVLAQKA